MATCYCCDDQITVDGRTCEFFDCYYDFNLLWLVTVTVCQYQCGADRIVTRRYLRILFFCKEL